MRLTNRLPKATALVWLLVGLTIIGLGLSMILTKDPRWMGWHLSRLGEGGHLSSHIFNYSLAFAAMLLILLFIRLRQHLLNVESTAYANLFTLCGIGIATCWLGIANFPFDQYPNIHNLFGYSMFTIMIILLLKAKQLIVNCSDFAYKLGLIGVILTAALMALHHATHLITLIIVEAIGHTIFLLWLIIITHQISHYKPKAR